MSKLSYLLAFVFIFSCSQIPTQVEEAPLVEPPPAVEVNKNDNSIRIKSVTEQISQDEPVKKYKSPKVRQRPLFDWPVWEARLTRGFLPRGTRKRKRPHKGIDLAAPRGSAVMSAIDGTVIYTGSGFSGYGKMIMIEMTHPDDGKSWATLYGHLDKILVYEGKKVKQGEVIGALGNTGRSSGPHLHFEIRRLDGPIDPLPLLPAGDALTNDVDNGSPDE